MGRSAVRLVAVGTAVLAAAADAAGFAIDVQGGRATGLGGAYATLADDPTAIFYNPAGLVGREGLQLALGASLIAPNVRFDPDEGPPGATLFNVSPPPHAYVAYGLHRRLAIGVGFFSAFGSSSRWPEQWSGRFASTGSQVSTYYLQPTVSVHLHDWVDGGFGVHLVRGTVLLERDLDFPGAPGEAALGGGAWGYGLDLGAKIKLIRGVLDIAVAWRGAVRLVFDGRAHFGGVPNEFTPFLHDQAVSSTITLPDTVQAGVALRPAKRFRAAFEVRHTSWSTIRQLEFDYQTAPTTTVPKLWHDTNSLHLGAEYDVSPALAARAGLVWDPTPSPAGTLAPDLPDSDRFKVAIGAGYSFGSLRVDGAYQFVLLTGERSSHPDFAGTYSGTAHVLGVTLGWAPQAATSR